MPFGPIELLVIKFPGNRFTGDILPAMAELVETGTVHIVDLLFVHKNAAGETSLLEFDDLAPDESGQWAPLATDVTPLLNDDDALQLAAGLDNDSSAGILLFENSWAARFAQAVRNAHGEVVLNERIPGAVIDEVLASASA
ncbi:MAG TPA: DUF6325 family protein [Thermomicrobiales bacterium]|nr:DUF6325 family protein [Thermomicrobiales bacterium]